MKALYRLFFSPEAGGELRVLGVMLVLVLIAGFINIVAILLEAYHG